MRIAPAIKSGLRKTLKLFLLSKHRAGAGLHFSTAIHTFIKTEN